jgi:predicted small integral membrane protein
MIEVRLAKIAMVASLAAFALLVAFDNVIDYGTNYLFVQHVLSMDTTFPDSTLRWRAITSPALWQAGYALIIAGEAATGLCFAAGTIALLRALRADAGAFQRAKRLALAGASMGFLVWFLGFMVVGGEWFQMWQSGTWNGQQAAFRFYLTLLAVAIFVNQPDAELPGAAAPRR